jgi:hypothetical protein
MQWVERIGVVRKDCRSRPEKGPTLIPNHYPIRVAPTQIKVPCARNSPGVAW